MSLPEILTLEEVARYLRVSDRTVYEWAQKGEIPAGKLGSSWRFKRADIQRWADEKLGADTRYSPSPSLHIWNVLLPSRVKILKEKGKKKFLEKLIDCLADAPEVTNRKELEQAIFRREKLMSTGIGLGVAVPHVRLDSVKDLVMAVGISRAGIADYASMDGKPVHIVCMIASGKYQHGAYLKLLAQISSRMREEAFRESLIASPDSKFLYKILAESGEESPE
jgi:nitrogen PTS system EIIA component